MFIKAVKYLDIYKIKILKATYKDIISLIIESIETKRTTKIGYINTYVLLKCLKDEELSTQINKLLLIPDGVGVYLSSKFLYGKNGLSERIVTTDLWYNILKTAGEKRYKIFFLGGSVEAAQLIRRKIKTSFPNLIITGVIDRDSYNDFETIRRLSESRSDILFVGLGTPLQEHWLHQNSERVNIPVQIAVGSAIEFFSGNYKRAPLVLRKIGLEWFYRLLKEPKRLWKRYLIGIPVFVFKILCFKVRLIMNKF